MAKKGGALPAYEELELIRAEGAVPVRRFVARLGIPASTWYHWRAGHLRGRPVRRWPAPVVDAIEEPAAQMAYRWSAWGHRKIWAMLRADGVAVSRSSVERALRRRDLLMPVRYQAERRQLAVARRALFVDAPARRNRVWQTDFTEYETSRGGTWRVSPVVDYATKVCLAAPVSGTTTARDAISALLVAIAEAERLLGHRLLDDCVDRRTGELTPVTIVTDNGPAYKSADFVHFIASRPSSPTSVPATTRPRPTAWSSGSTKRSSTSICTAMRSPTRSSSPTKSKSSGSSTTRSVRTRPWVRSHR